jgi:hypothetical protein
LELNGEETRTDAEEDIDIGAMRALGEILINATFGVEEIFIAYTEINQVWIQVLHPAGFTVNYPAKGREDLTPICLYFYNDNHYESVNPADFETKEERQGIAKKKYPGKTKSSEQRIGSEQAKKRKRKFDAQGKKFEPKEK